jgi:hypothetical protein
MKTARRVFAASLVALGMCAFGHAQSAPSWTVSVPFNFTAGKASMETGRYTVYQFDRIFVVQSRDGKEIASLMATPDYTSQPAAHTSLIFARVNGHYMLAGIREQGSDTQYKVPARKSVQIERSASPTAPLSVEVAATAGN